MDHKVEIHPTTTLQEAKNEVLSKIENIMAGIDMQRAKPARYPQAVFSDEEYA